MDTYLKQVLENLDYGIFENLNLEFKGSFDFTQNVWAREHLVRTILAMSNTENGGRIIIGLKENGDKSVSKEGITSEHLPILKSKIEELKTKVEVFASSPVDFDLSFHSIEGKDFILIDVKEFVFNPIICRKKGDHPQEKILEEGIIYIRTLKDKPSSVKAVEFIDIEHLLNRGMQKKINRLHKEGWQHKSENKQYDYKKERGNF